MTDIPPPSARSALHRPHVLIVSDDLGLRHFLAEGLLLAGFWTSSIASAIQVLEVFRLRSFDLVLIDARLSGMDGAELVRRLRGRSPRAAAVAARTDVPLLLIAGGPDEIDPADAQRAGADRVLTPPLELADLAPLLHDLIARWRADHPDRPFADALAQAPPSPPSTT